MPQQPHTLLPKADKSAPQLQAKEPALKIDVSADPLKAGRMVRCPELQV